MPQPQIQVHQFDNGLVLLAQPMDWLRSVSFAIQLPAGFVYDPPDQLGLANFACEMAQRGAGPFDSRQFVEQLDGLGIDRSASVSAAHTSFGVATLAEHLDQALTLYAQQVRAPRLPSEEIEQGRQVCFQEIWASEDDLAQKTLQRLKTRHYGDPWGRVAHGKFESVERISSADIQQFVEQTYRPQGAILSVAGRLDWNRLRDHVESLLGDWSGGHAADFYESLPPGGYEHVPQESQQTQIGVAFASVPYAHPDYFQARGAVGILSDGMSSRLFTEIREKRALCYAVYAASHSLRDRGAVLCYAGTSTERAQETLDVLVAELRRLPKGVEPDEVARLKARIKSSLIMQQESSAARAGAMATDWYHLGRVMTMEELAQIIDSLTCATITGYLGNHPPSDFTVVTLGEQPLEVPR